MRWYDLTDEQYGASHYNFTPPTITVGDSLEVVEVEVVSCVKEKLVNRIAEGGWEFIPSPTVDIPYTSVGRKSDRLVINRSLTLHLHSQTS